MGQADQLHQATGVRTPRHGDLRRSGHRALQFQPRVVGVVVLVGVVLRSPVVFIALSAVLWWSTLLPELSPFDMAYNRLIAVRRGSALLAPAPRPRRFAQGMAAITTTLIAVSLRTGHHLVAGAIEAFMLAAVGAILFRGFCLGSFVYHVLAGNREFASSHKRAIDSDA